MADSVDKPQGATEAHPPTPAEIARTSAQNDDGYLRLAAWFLGPRAENQQELHGLLGTALQMHGEWRRNYFPQDPPYVTEQVKASPIYQRELEKIKDAMVSLSLRLRNSQPFFSSRYKGHMNWDASMIGRLGYFATALFNPNNVATEGSPVTTAIEYEVAQDLCQMLGYPLEPSGTRPRSWGHITSCGSNANTESLWAARNVKFLTRSIAKALNEVPALASQRNVLKVRTAAGQEKLVADLDDWDLLNVPADEALGAQLRLVKAFDQDTVTTALKAYDIQQTGMWGLKPAVYFVPATRHYSWDKAGAILGIGQRQMLTVNVDSYGRVDLLWLDAMLRQCLLERTPVLQVVVVVGTTTEGVVDPVGDVLALRDKYRALGLDFYLHADAAWGGYFCSMLQREFMELVVPPDRYVPPLTLSTYVTDQLLNYLPRVDSITIDPHKSGWIQYPAGGLCYKNEYMRNLLAFSAPVIVPPTDLPGASDASIGIFGIEGSKPGAAVAAVYLHHRVVGLNPSGHGRLCAQAHFTTKMIYATLATMEGPNDPFAIAPYQPLRPGLRDFLLTRVLGKSNREIFDDAEAMNVLSTIGPDLLINAFALNFSWPILPYDAAGKLTAQRVRNTRLELANDLLLKVGDELNVAYQQVDSQTVRRQGVARHGLFMIRNTLKDHQQAVKNVFQHSLGLEQSTGDMHYMVNSNMDPWPSATAFLPTVLEPELRNAILRGIGAIKEEPDIHGFVVTEAPAGDPEKDTDVFGDHLPMFYMPEHNYHLIVKLAFKTPEDKRKAWRDYKDKLPKDEAKRANVPFVVGNVDKFRLYDLINWTPSADKKAWGWNAELRCGFPGQPYDKPFGHAQLQIVDVIRNYHLDPRDAALPKPADPQYFMYGVGGRAYVSHMFKALPDYHYVAEVAVPPGFSTLLLDLGITVDLVGAPVGQPLTEGAAYAAKYVGDEGARAEAQITVKTNVWFDDKIINMQPHDAHD